MNKPTQPKTQPNQPDDSSTAAPHALDRDLLTVEQAAAFLQLSQSSIRSYIRQNKLIAFRIAGKRKVLIARSEMMKLLEPARTMEPIEPTESVQAQKPPI